MNDELFQSPRSVKKRILIIRQCNYLVQRQSPRMKEKRAARSQIDNKNVRRYLGSRQLENRAIMGFIGGALMDFGSRLPIVSH